MLKRRFWNSKSPGSRLPGSRRPDCSDGDDKEEPSLAPTGPRVVLVTGATSVLGRLLAAEILATPETSTPTGKPDPGRRTRVLALVRPSSAKSGVALRAKLERAQGPLGDRFTVVIGDVTEPGLGLSHRDLPLLSEVTEIIHLARPNPREEGASSALAKGLDHVVAAAKRVCSTRRLVVLSSTAIMGDYKGRFYEDWLDVGQSLPTEAGRAALEHERRARSASEAVPIVVARRGTLVGHSQTGESPGPSGFSQVLATAVRLSRLPSVVRPPAPAEGMRYVLISPVDYVAKGLWALASSPTDLAGQTFALVDPNPPTLAELWESLLRSAGGPRPGIAIPVDGKGPVGRALQLVATAGWNVSAATGNDPGFWGLLTRRGDHDAHNAVSTLEPVGIACPPLESYLDVLIEEHRRHGERFTTQ